MKKKKGRSPTSVGTLERAMISKLVIQSPLKNEIDSIRIVEEDNRSNKS
jgi:hypothetical protein